MFLKAFDNLFAETAAEKLANRAAEHFRDCLCKLGQTYAGLIKLSDFSDNSDILFKRNRRSRRKNRVNLFHRSTLFHPWKGGTKKQRWTWLGVKQCQVCC
jgi:hypothetical protein